MDGKSSVGESVSGRLKEVNDQNQPGNGDERYGKKRDTIHK